MDNLLSIAGSNAVAATILALVAILIGAVYRCPALVHGLWLLVLLKLVTPPLLYLPVSWPATPETPPEKSAAVTEGPAAIPVAVAEERDAVAVVAPAGEEKPAAGGPAPAIEVGEPRTSPRSPLAEIPSPQSSLWPHVLAIIWSVGALAWFLLALERLHRFRRLLRFARPAPEALQERARRLAQALALKRCPRVRLLPGHLAPMLWAIGGPPRLLVPADLVAVLSDEQLDTLLLHELAHLRRRDHWVRVLEFLVMGLYWWHPVVWYARRELREAEEQCCDAWVVSTLPGAGRTYASALMETLDFLSTTQAAMPPLASGLSQIADLKRRLTMIMRGNTPRSLTWPGCLAVVALGLTFLPMLPSLHGEAPSEDEARKPQRLQQETEKVRNEAQAQVERQKALVEAEKARLKQAEAALKAAEAQAREFEKQGRLRAELIEKRKQALSVLALVENKVVYRIEITLPAEANAKEAREVIAAIQKALPEELRGRVHLRVAVQENRPLPAAGIPVVPATSPDKRINDLEKKLEKVLHELHELRKQMKEPRSGATPPPATYYEAVPTPPTKPYRIVPAPNPQPEGAAPRAVPPPAPNDPYSAPTVPLAPTPVSPARR